SQSPLVEPLPWTRRAARRPPLHVPLAIAQSRRARRDVCPGESGAAGRVRRSHRLRALVGLPSPGGAALVVEAARRALPGGRALRAHVAQPAREPAAGARALEPGPDRF